MKIIIVILIIVFMFPVFANAERVRGYWRDTNKDGIKDKYVNPYNRSDRNDSIRDNYSTKGNINPYTGKEGTVNPFQDDFNKSYKSDNLFDIGKSQRKQKNLFDND